MTGRGRGRARGTEAGKPTGPAGRGSGLQTQAPADTPRPAETPALGSTSAGRGRARASSQSTASPGASPLPSSGGRGRAQVAEKRPVGAPPGLGESSPSPAPDAEKRPEGAAPGLRESPPSPAPDAAEPVPKSGSSNTLNLADIVAALPAIPQYKRPPRGMKGIEIKLQSNLYGVVLKGETWYKYDVALMTTKDPNLELAGAANVKNKDRIQSRHFNRVVIDELFKRHETFFGDRSPAYDGRKTLISSKKFWNNDMNEHTFTVEMERNERGGRKTVVVTLKLVLEIDVTQVNAFYNNNSACPLSPEVIQAGNIVIDSTLGRHFVAVNRSYYATSQSLNNPMNPSYLGGGKELRSGIYTSLRFAEWGPLLVVDKSNTAFYKGCDLIQYISDFLEDRHRNFLQNGFRREQMLLLSRDLKRLTVRLKHSQKKRCVKIHGLSEEAAGRIEFPRADNTTTTVAKYFNETYAHIVGELKYPHLPCVTVVRGTKTDYFPLEVCEIQPDQPYKKKLNPMQTAKMIRNCQEAPNERMRASIQNVRTIKRIAAQVIRQHGVEINEVPIETVGRRIISPMIRVKNESIKPNDGSWRQRCFHEGAKLDQWCVVDCAEVGQLAHRLSNFIFSVAQKMGLEDVKNALNVISGTRRNLHDIFNELSRMRRNKERPLLAVFILGSSPVMYSQIKLLSEIREEYKGIITQCIKGENIGNEKKFNEMFVSNVMKKINVKLGGVNNVIHERSIPKRFEKEPFIVIGADVNHAAPGDCLTPSIAAVVGSIDSVPSKYWTEVSVQTNEGNNRIEYIKNLQAIARNLLIEHRKATNRVPQHIYYIRDGVSEGQFEAVRLFEINALRKACKELNQDYQPKMTVLIAQKRHHVRFNVMDPTEGTGKMKNVPPGTYIDRDVVHPERFDFYMYTHQGLLGTSRPTHYHLIHSDDKTFTTDEITEIINHLCYVYARSSSAVSIPAPIYYAHHAAARAKEHIKGNMSLSGADAQSVSSGGEINAEDLQKYVESCANSCDVKTEYRGSLYYA